MRDGGGAAGVGDVRCATSPSPALTVLPAAPAAAPTAAAPAVAAPTVAVRMELNCPSSGFARVSPTAEMMAGASAETCGALGVGDVAPAGAFVAGGAPVVAAPVDAAPVVAAAAGAVAAGADGAVDEAAVAAGWMLTGLGAAGGGVIPAGDVAAGAVAAAGVAAAVGAAATVAAEGAVATAAAGFSTLQASLSSSVGDQMPSDRRLFLRWYSISACFVPGPK